MPPISRIGMNTAIIPNGQGLGFAIDADTIRQVVPDLIKNGRVIRPSLGFIYAEFTPRLARRFGMEYIEGIIIQTYKNSCAEEAGLTTGDIIVEAEGKSMKTSNDLQSMMKGKKIGDKVPLVVVRDGKKYKMSLTLCELPAM